MIVLVLQLEFMCSNSDIVRKANENEQVMAEWRHSHDVTDEFNELTVLGQETER